MKRIISVSAVLFLVFALADLSFAQIGPQGYNPNSVRPILESDVMYRTTIWRRVNLLEKQNKPFFSYQNEITKVIIDAVQEKKVQPYYNKTSPRLTSFEEPMEVEDFMKNLKYWDDQFQDSVNITPSQLYVLEMKEDLIFDRRRSRMYWDIQSITMVIPQGTNPETEMGDVPFATFKFKDLYNYFKETYNESQEKGTFEDLRAFWYNPSNPRRHVSLADAFDLRLFSSRIFKVSNPDDKEVISIINDEYGDDPGAAKRVLYMSQKIEYDLMEFEHNLWEF
ncbi:MAG: gliding motility protein GldN [Microscillaceae bacterium]|nr:gliding motility protein GldN [Microscillaceae bacterium]